MVPGSYPDCTTTPLIEPALMPVFVAKIHNFFRALRVWPVENLAPGLHGFCPETGVFLSLLSVSGAKPVEYSTGLYLVKTKACARRADDGIW